MCQLSHLAFASKPLFNEVKVHGGDKQGHTANVIVEGVIEDQNENVSATRKYLLWLSYE